MKFQTGQIQQSCTTLDVLSSAWTAVQWNAAVTPANEVNPGPTRTKYRQLRLARGKLQLFIISMTLVGHVESCFWFISLITVIHYRCASETQALLLTAKSTYGVTKIQNVRR
ncbi:hypothetical protein BDR07DRAFT_1399662 [Suillus spraguei]|nr:hypothetical protein BDR07DRAFT_1399662 [Suillus spraguei]